MIQIDQIAAIVLFFLLSVHKICLVYGKLVSKSMFHWVLISSYQTCTIFHYTFSGCSAMMLVEVSGGESALKSVTGVEKHCWK